MQQVENPNMGTLNIVHSPSVAVQNKWVNGGIWVLQILLALVFLGAGGAKLVGVEAMVEEFQKIGIGQWFRYVTGVVEVFGAIALLIPRLSGFGAVTLAGTMMGAIFTHLFIFQNSPVAPLVLFVPLAVIAWTRRDTLIKMLG